ncbi:MAG: Tim44/TimA family putative adaptor protein [Rickettsiales bacterium]|nr:Tim44/TimA family putative adaptor protein [Rickettsiales bacterium]
MSDGIPYADIVILALIAGFILLRLRSVLGQNSGDEGGMFKKNSAPTTEQKLAEALLPAPDKINKTKAKEEYDPLAERITDAEIAKTILALKEKDAQFTVTGFMSGAKMAYEMVFDAFAKGDKQTLMMLLSSDTLKHFTDAIDALQAQANRTETTLLSVVANTISSASLQKNMARITVDFTSEQITVVRDSEGNVIEGNVSSSERVDDSWTFERDVTSKNPNWKIIET